jgi:hypothetical protein
MHFPKFPYACQAIRTECIGWLFGATKAVDSKTFVPALRLKLKIPDYVPIGIQWRTIKNENKKNYKWNADEMPPQALHLDIDANHATRYTEEAAKLWKKGATNRVNGLQMRLIPCLGSNRAVAISENQRHNMKLMAAKQQFFVNSYTVKVDNAHIMNLDAPVKEYTLRKYLMSRSPKTSVIQRLFVSVDKSWRGNDFTLVTVKPYAAEAMKALNCMIPECIHLYGIEAAELWFSNAGLLAYQGVKWDPTKQSTTSHKDQETKALVDEDLFQIGTNWMLTAPIMQAQAGRQAPPQTPDYTVQNLLASRGHGNDVSSFGSIYQRQHDDDSIVTTKTTTEAMDINTNPSVLVHIDPTLAIQPQRNNADDQSYGASSAGFTTDSTRKALRDERAVVQNLLKEMKQLEGRDTDSDNQSIKTTKSTQDKLVEALAMIEQMKLLETMTPPAQILISPDPKAKAPAHEEHPATAAASTGSQI